MLRVELGLFGLGAAGDAFDFYPGQFAAVTDGPVITFPAPIFKRDDLLVLALLDYFAGNLTAVAELSAVDVHQHLEGGCFTRFDVEKIDIHRVAQIMANTA